MRCKTWTSTNSVLPLRTKGDTLFYDGDDAHALVEAEVKGKHKQLKVNVRWQQRINVQIILYYRFSYRQCVDDHNNKAILSRCWGICRFEALASSSVHISAYSGHNLLQAAGTWYLTTYWSMITISMIEWYWSMELNWRSHCVMRWKHIHTTILKECSNTAKLCQEQMNNPVL